MRLGALSGMLVLLLVAAPACSNAPKYRPLDGGGDASDSAVPGDATQDTGGGGVADTVLGPDGPGDASADGTAPGDADADGTGTDAPPGTVCAPACESYQTCTTGRCTPRYVATTNLSGGQNVRVSAIEIGADGAFYVAGAFMGSTDFNPGTGLDLIAGSEESFSAFLSRFNPDGSYAWTRTFLADSLSSSSVAALKRAPGNTIVLVGSCRGQVDFDPGPAVAGHTTSPDSEDAFIAKFSQDGSILLTRFVEANGGKVHPSRVDLTSDGTILTVGRFEGSVDFDPGPGSEVIESTEDGFVTTLTPFGQYGWTTVISGALLLGGAALGSDGSIWLAGSFESEVDFDPGPDVDTRRPTGLDAFVTRLNSSGDYDGTMLIQGMSDQRAFDLTASGDSIYVAGYFSSSVDFDPGSGVQMRTSAGAPFLLGLGLDGAFRSVYTAGANSTYMRIRATTEGGVLFLKPTSCALIAGDRAVWTIPLPELVFPLDLAVGSSGFGVVGEFDFGADFDPGTTSDNIEPTPGAASNFLSKYAF